MCSRRSASIRWKCIGWIGSRRSFSLRECATTPRVRSGRASAFLGMERGLDDSVFARLRLLVGSLFLERLSGLLRHGLTRRFIGHHWSLDWEPERSRCLDGTPHPARTPPRLSTLHDHWWRGADAGICDHMNRRNVRRPLGGDSQDTPNKRSNKQDRSRWLFWAGASAWSRPSSAGGGKKNRRVMAKGAPTEAAGRKPRCPSTRTRFGGRLSVCAYRTAAEPAKTRQLAAASGG